MIKRTTLFLLPTENEFFFFDRNGMWVCSSNVPVFVSENKENRN